MSIALSHILSLVGKLDDSLRDEVPREQFRNYLQQNVKDIADVRDYVQECLRNSGDQYNRAPQDLVNFIGGFLAFEVTCGHYQRVQDNERNKT